MCKFLVFYLQNILYILCFWDPLLLKISLFTNMVNYLGNRTAAMKSPFVDAGLDVAFVNYNIIYDAFIKSDMRDKRPHNHGWVTSVQRSFSTLCPCVGGCLGFEFVAEPRVRQADWQGTRLRVPDSCQRQKHRSGGSWRRRERPERRRHFNPNGVNFLMSSV